MGLVGRGGSRVEIFWDVVVFVLLLVRVVLLRLWLLALVVLWVVVLFLRLVLLLL